METHDMSVHEVAPRTTRVGYARVKSVMMSADKRVWRMVVGRKIERRDWRAVMEKMS